MTSPYLPPILSCDYIYHMYQIIDSRNALIILWILDEFCKDMFMVLGSKITAQLMLFWSLNSVTNKLYA